MEGFIWTAFSNNIGTRCVDFSAALCYVGKWQKGVVSSGGYVSRYILPCVFRFLGSSLAFVIVADVSEAS